MERSSRNHILQVLAHSPDAPAPGTTYRYILPIHASLSLSTTYLSYDTALSLSVHLESRRVHDVSYSRNNNRRNFCPRIELSISAMLEAFLDRQVDGRHRSREHGNIWDVASLLIRENPDRQIIGFGAMAGIGPGIQK